MTKEIAVKTMAKADARAFVSTINKGIGDIREMLIELRDSKGWEALGYGSWDACVTEEFGWSKRYANMQISGGKIEQQLLAAPAKAGTIVPTPPTSPVRESHLRPLVGLTEKQQVKAYTDARAAAEKAGKPLTAKDVKAKADAYKPAAPKPQPAPKTCPKEEAPDPAVDKTKARQALGQLVRSLDELGIAWSKLTFNDVEKARGALDKLAVLLDDLSVDYGPMALQQVKDALK